VTRVPLFITPVEMPYRLSDDRGGSLFPVRVDAIAQDATAAVAAAQVLIRSLATLRHRGRTIELVPERIRIGAVGREMEGPYAYVLAHGNHIQHLAFPARLDNKAGEVMGNAFSGLDPNLLLGVVMDCSPLAYINTSGLASIAAHAKRIRLRLFRVSESVRRVFQIVGLTEMLRILPDLRSALDDLATHAPATPASST
jgi:anti-anti-sigma regulatory factor